MKRREIIGAAGAAAGLAMVGGEAGAAWGLYRAL